MNYRLTLDPKLGLSAFDFIITWNRTPACRSAALARTAPATPVLFDQDRIMGTSVILSGAGNESAEEIGNLIRQALQERGVRQPLELTQTDLPDGTRDILVKL